MDPQLLARLGIGLLQGLALLMLSRWHSRAAEEGPLFSALAFGAALLPMVLLAGWGEMRRRALALWAGLALVLVLGLGYYASWRTGTAERYLDPDLSSIVFAALVVFIAHHLVEVGVKAGRLKGDYGAYFDLTWKHGVQLALSGLFTGVFWLVLGLGASLFALIGISTIGDIITKDWFALPATALAFAGAVHLTDARASLVIGARALALTLLGWLLPLMVVMVGAFLVALPIAGLAGLWSTNFASALLMWAATVLIFLLNAAYQDGEKPVNALVAGMVRLGCLLLVPLCGLAAYGLLVRVGQHGLTTERVIACAGLLLLSAYAVGYAIAALTRGAWLARFGAANVWCALLSVAVLLGLLSPLADPSRLAVQSQMARLTRGAVPLEKFDFAFLKDRSGRWGEAALQKLANGGGDARSLEIAAAAKAFEADLSPPANASSVAARRELVPDLTGEGAAPIPDGAFLMLEGGADPIRDCVETKSDCSMRQIDLDGDGPKEILLFNGYGRVQVLQPGPAPTSPWREAAQGCCVLIEAWTGGELALVPQRFANLKAGDKLLNLTLSQPPP